MKTLTRWGAVALVIAAMFLVAFNRTSEGSARSLLLAATLLGVAAGPAVSRCLGNPSLTPNETARPTLVTSVAVPTFSTPAANVRPSARPTPRPAPAARPRPAPAPVPRPEMAELVTTRSDPSA